MKKMYSQRHVEKLYAKLLHDVQTSDFYKIDLSVRTNCYECDLGHITKTKDVDAGVTPFIISCEKCQGIARSHFYKNVYPDLSPTIEWYRPSLSEVLKMRKHPDLLDHILKGGLERRKIK